MSPKLVSFCVINFVVCSNIINLSALVVTNETPSGPSEDSASPNTPNVRFPVTKRILVFGGNGFLGADTVQRFIDRGDNVTIVNRGNWYWDSHDRIRPYVDHISCDRQNDIESCENLVNLLNAIDDPFDAVVDFSAYGEKETKDAGALLKGKAKLYVLISTDSVYDVCKKDHDGPSKESDSNRPKDEHENNIFASYSEYGHKKLRAEEELVKHRAEGNGVPYVILRLPDVIGPRDPTYRWWLYQLWAKLESELEFKPVSIPEFIEDYDISFVYSPDVAKLIDDMILQASPKLEDEIFNVGFPQTFTLKELITSIRKNLDVNKSDIKTETNQTETLFVYPSVRKGPIDVSKLQKELEWVPTPWEEAVKETVSFFEEAMAGDKFSTQKDEIVQVFTLNLFENHKNEVYSALEKVYKINLQHFRPRDEL